jgi:hypothetical protein
MAQAAVAARGIAPGAAVAQTAAAAAASGVSAASTSGGTVSAIADTTGMPGVGAAGTAAMAVPGLPGATPTSDRALPAEEEAPPAQAGQPAAGESEPYAPRNLHLFADAQGVHAWIRDAALSAYQARGVAQALAAEFFRQGAVLASVSLNGRNLGAHSSRDSGDEPSAVPLFDLFAESVPSRKPAKGVSSK